MLVSPLWRHRPGAPSHSSEQGCPGPCPPLEVKASLSLGLEVAAAPEGRGQPGDRRRPGCRDGACTRRLETLGFQQQTSDDAAFQMGLMTDNLHTNGLICARRARNNAGNVCEKVCAEMTIASQCADLPQRGKEVRLSLDEALMSH